MWLGSRRLFVGIIRDIAARREVERLKSNTSGSYKKVRAGLVATRLKA
jgi:hypothetical protein